MRFANRIRPTVVLNDDRGTIVHPATSTRSRPVTGEVRAARLEVARRAGWTELEETQLVSRGPARFGWLVDSVSDRIYVLDDGARFAPGQASLISGERDESLAFYVNTHGDVVVVKRVDSPESWSQVVRRQSMRAAP